MNEGVFSNDFAKFQFEKLFSTYLRFPLIFPLQFLVLIFFCGGFVHN